VALKQTQRLALEARLKALLAKLEEKKIKAIFITSPENRRYYSGFTSPDHSMVESSGTLLVTPQKQYLITDSRFTLAAAQEAPYFEVIDGVLERGQSWVKKVDLEKGSQAVFEPGYLNYARFMSLAKILRNEFKISFKPSPFDPGELRARKSPSELKLIAVALTITEKALANLWSEIELGTTEKEAADYLDRDFKQLGADGPGFETIVAAGARAALPHARPGSKRFERGDMVIIDCGARYQGYNADITRTYCLEPLKDWQKEIYGVVREAQNLAIKEIAPGRLASQIDAVARNYIAAAGYGKYFGHSLGHGVGLDVHEEPRISENSRACLEEGQAVTIEPGIYLPNRGGVRLEQLVVVTQNGYKILNKDNHFYYF
jgi:Xaa-Pro aminopeptidase